MLKKFFMVLLLATANGALALTEAKTTVPTKNITFHRMHSITHSIPGARNVYLVAVKGLDQGCSTIYIQADKDPFLFSATLAGLSNLSNTVTFLYHVDASTRGPWGDSSACQLTSFSVVN